jgi:GNAT superfamily N-acetyltransferase
LIDIDVKPVRNRKDKQIFLTFPWQIFRDDPLWVPPLLPDLKERTNPSKGIFFGHGRAEFYVAWRNSQPVGTICAAEDRQANAERGVSECVFGFFHFIEDYTVMEALLAQVEAWALERGLDALTGPFNLDYEDSYGILVEGRDRPPALMCGHTPAYYLDFIERSGFVPARGDNIALAFDLTIKTPAWQELQRVADWLRRRRRFVIRPADMRHWEDELEKIYILLNTALRHLPDYRSWPREVVFNSLAPFRKIADPDMILFAEDGDHTVGWLPGLPNLNEVLIHVNGLRYPWDYLKLGWYMRHRPDSLTVKSVLVPQEYWGSGVAILLFDEMIRRALERGYKWIDASLTSTDNPNTPILADRFEVPIYKRYRVYRKKIQPNQQVFFEQPYL